MPKRQFVVLGDVVGSRDVHDREALRDDLSDALATVNDDHDEAIRAPFTMLKGVDEIGGVLKDLSVLYDVVRTVYMTTYPTTVRFVGALGEVDVSADADSVAEMDGPVFHRADDMLETIADDGRLFNLDTGDPFADVLVGNYVNLCLMVMNAWTPKEVEILREYERRGTQTAVAEALGVTQQRVSKAIRETDWDVFSRMESDLNEILDVYDDLVSDDRDF